MTTNSKSSVNTKNLPSLVGIIGAGQMGIGIAQVCAQSGFKTVLCDHSPETLRRSHESLISTLGRLVEKGKLTAEQMSTTTSNLSTADDFQKLKECDLIIEAIVENAEVKRKLFVELDKICKPSTVFASNTSSISITNLASSTTRPELFIGMHFMNPVPLMKLVEVIRGLQTNEATYKTVIGVVEVLEKTPVTARCDYPGFVVNRILLPLLNEAFFALMEGVASAEEIDTAMKLGTNMPMGPLQLADFIGLDTVLSICKIFHAEFGDSKYRPCPLLVKYVEAGWLGKKTGRGVFTY